MKRINIYILLWSCLLLASCTIIDLEDPLKGKVTLTTDWSKRTQGISQPANYTVVINGQTLNYTAASNLLPELDEGTYPIYVYNKPEDISINSTSATVTTAGTTVEALPGYLFTSITEATYGDFKTEAITAIMQQQVRRLSFELDITGGNPTGLQSVTASLTGVANTMNFDTNTYSGTGLKVVPVLTIDGSKIKGEVRLIGLTTEAQVLTLDIIYTTGKTQQIVTDVSNQLANFNADKHIAITLTNNMEITNKAGFEATINKWDAKTEKDGTAW